jgi:hypothetical protein
VLVIRRIIVDEINPVSPAVEGGQHHLIQKLTVRLGVEVFGLVTIGKPTAFERNRAEHFLGVALPARWNARLGV